MDIQNVLEAAPNCKLIYIISLSVRSLVQREQKGLRGSRRSVLGQKGCATLATFSSCLWKGPSILQFIL